MKLAPKCNRDEYRQLNQSYKKTLVFGIGLEAGFYSEFNNMILAILFCLQHKIRFVLHSETANFRFHTGWNDFFEPFCDEKNNWFTNRFDHRFPSEIVFYKKYILQFIKRLYGIDFFTCDLFYQIHSRENESSLYVVPELGLNDEIQKSCKQLINLFYRFNEETRSVIDTMKHGVSFEDKYIGFHIRGGDKIIEHELINVDEYIRKSESISSIKQGFVYTDDYRIFTLLCKKYPDWKFQTLTEKNEKGYFHTDFQNLSNETKRLQLIKMFASMELLCAAEHTICTYSSNVGMFLGMMMGERAVGVDFDAWRIW